MIAVDQRVRPRPAGPVLSRRRLADDLRRHRLAAARTISEVAEQLDCSPAKVSRMETGAVKVRTPDLRAMLDFYDIGTPERERMFSLVRQARQRPWWYEFTDVVPPGSATLYGLEDGAVTIEQHAPSLVPGLLQAERYLRALIGSTDVPGETARRQIELRLRRQEVLTRPAAPALSVVLDEAVLHRPVGGREAMVEQLRHLLEVGEAGRAVVRILPFEVGVHPGLGVGFTVFDFDASAAPVVFTEQLTRNAFLDEPDEVAVYRSAWLRVRELAASPSESRRMLARQVERFS